MRGVMVAEQSDGVSIDTVWVGVDDLSIQLCNQSIVQNSGGLVLLTLGQVAPPVLSGDPDSQFEQLTKTSFVPIKPLVRVSLTPTTAAELRHILDQVLALMAQGATGEAG